MTKTSKAPIPDEKAQTLANDLIDALNTISGGEHPGYRPAHAKGVLAAGEFTPSPEAASLTSAPHANQPSTPITVRFSDSSGLPEVADNDGNTASPRGLAIRFHLGEHVHTDIIGHSHNGFPVRTPEEFLTFLHAAAASGPGASKPSPVEQFLGSHPAALAFIQAPKPVPSSFAREHYFTVTAFKFVAADGAVHFGRFRVLPAEGTDYPDAATLPAKSSNFLFEELASRLAAGPARFHIVLQLSEPGDVVDDVTIHWPESRKLVPFGTISVSKLYPHDDVETSRIIFDPIPRVEGIESSGDPLLDARANVYLTSGRRRRKANE